MALKITENGSGRLGIGTSISGDVTGSLPGPVTVDAVNGLPPSWKNPVRVATTTAGTLASSFEPGDTIDGVVLVDLDRILIKDQAAPEENGIYIVNSTGLIRSVDMDEADEVVGSAVYVIEGTANAASIWLNTNTSDPVIDTDAITFTEFAAASGALTVINGGGGTVQAHGNLGSTETIDTANGNYHWGTLNANCTFTFTTIADTAERWFTLELIEDGTGGWTVTWPGSVTWLGGATPTHTTTAGTTTIYAFFTRDGGTTWIGGQLGAGGAGFATPAIVLGTAAAAGAAATTIRSDATILAFDATLPASIGTAATGAAAVAARRDHVHDIGTALSTAGVVGPLLITDTPAGSPLVFADLLQTEAGDDLLYADV